MGGDSEDIYCRKFMDNGKWSNDISWKIGYNDSSYIMENNILLFWWKNWNIFNLQGNKKIITISIIR